MKHFLSSLAWIFILCLVLPCCGTGGNGEQCTPNDRTVCKDGAVYWVDSCGNQGDKAGDCDCGCNADFTACKDPCDCVPDCSNRECGSDPVCGQSCGDCEYGELCTVDGICLADCTPDCSGRECGPDPVCQTSCGDCEDGEICTEEGVCETCTPDCTDRECGPDPVCEQPCGTCATGGEWCNEGLCSACDSAEHCGPECLECTGETPDCQGAVEGCVCNDESCEEGNGCDPVTGECTVCVCADTNDCCDGCFSINDGTTCDTPGDTCTVFICNQGFCVLDILSEYCRIDGVCIAHDANSTTNECIFCDSEAGQTVWSNRPSDYACDDGQPCTYDDLCDGAGGCVGTPITCDNDDPPCGAERACNGTSTCTVTYPGSDTTCDSGDPCIIDDHCDGAGGCTGTVVVCDDDPAICGVKRECNNTADCTETYPDSTTTCDDGEPCTYDDKCDGSGTCVGTAISCTDDPETCGANRECNGTGNCTVTYPDSTTTCDDGDPCTYDDHCDGSGGCVGTSIVCTDDPGTCGANRQCNGSSTCTVTYPDSSTSCDDGDICTYDDKCDGSGSCGGTGISCDDDPTTCGANRACNGTSTCTVTYPDSNTYCDDGDLCTYLDRCDGTGSCAGTALECNDAPGVCGANRECNGSSVCTVTYPDSSTSCDDGNLCTYGDACNGSGSCSPGTPIVCDDDPGACGADRECNGTSTCTVTYPTAGTPCDDGDLCTYDETCDGGGNCTGGTAVVCNDDPTTCGADRSCNGTASCTVTFPDSSVPCDDGDICTYGETCNGIGGCANGTAISCSDDPGICGANRACNGTDTCTVTYPDSTTSCDDSDLCTYSDHCDSAGSCVGTSISCTSEPGTCGLQRACNGTSSCSEYYPDGTVSCDDGELCTYNDACDGAGSCAGTAVVCESDPGTCGTQRSCNGSSSCTETWPDGTTACDDGDLCTTDDACNGLGSCGGNPIVCGQHASCTAGVCVCDGGWGNCNTDWGDGCEADVTGIVEICDNGLDDDCNGFTDCEDAACDGAKCDLCGVCSAGVCAAAADDEECGTVDCSLWYSMTGTESPTARQDCYNKQDITSNRCADIGLCKAPNSSACSSQANDMLQYSCDTCCGIFSGNCTGTNLGSCSFYSSSTQGPTYDTQLCVGSTALGNYDYWTDRDYHCTGNSCSETFNDTHLRTCGLCSHCTPTGYIRCIMDEGNFSPCQSCKGYSDDPTECRWECRFNSNLSPSGSQSTSPICDWAHNETYRFGNNIGGSAGTCGTIYSYSSYTTGGTGTTQCECVCR